jgi:hypothetical protein
MPNNNEGDTQPFYLEQARNSLDAVNAMKNRLPAAPKQVSAMRRGAANAAKMFRGRRGLFGAGAAALGAGTAYLYGDGDENQEEPMKKTAEQLADMVLEKCALAITDAGHALDASNARAKQTAYTQMLKNRQQYKADGGMAWAPEYQPRNAARHQAYKARQHEQGSNAWNPLGGYLTPTKDEPQV